MMVRIQQILLYYLELTVRQKKWLQFYSGIRYLFNPMKKFRASMNIGCFRICRLITDLQISIWIIKAVMREEICHGFLIILTDIYSDTTILFMV